MQTMDMGSAETTLTQMQISSLPPPASSSYYLQLDPSGHVDILESSLVMNKPELSEETVYEIQLDPFVIDERNNGVEIYNLQNLQTPFTFQPEFLDASLTHQQYTTAVTYEPQQIQFHLDDTNFNQMLLSNNLSTVVSAPVVNKFEENHIVEEVDFVPDYGIETEIPADPSDDATTQECPMIEAPSGYASDDDESIPDTLKLQDDSAESGETNEVKSILEPIAKSVKRDTPNNIMNFTEEAVMPPLVMLDPTPNKECLSPNPFSHVEILSEESDDDEKETSENKLMVPALLYENMDPDDELFISFHSRTDPTKTSLCVLCYEWFGTASDLDEHLKTMHQDNMKLYGCKRCGKQFWSRFLRHRHEKMHRFDLKGPLSRYFPGNRPFDHYESKHFLKRLRPAPVTQNYKERLQELHNEVKSMLYDCLDCNKGFKTEEEYREHCEEEHVVQVCFHCRKTFENAKNLQAHEQEVHGKITFSKNYSGGAWKLWENWDCEEVKEKDERLMNLYLYHNYSKNAKYEGQSSSEIDMNCDINMDCGDEEMVVRVKTKDGERRKSSDKSSRKSSKGGGSSGSKKKKSSTHQTSPEKNSVKAIVTELKEIPLVTGFKCEHCKISYDTEADLQRHLKTHTIRSMAYMCQYCGRGFATHSNRKEHERIHTGDKPYVCPICTRAFVQISNLKKHIQTHKDKNNLQCTTCQKQFVKESSLILHQRAHSQDRKFRCHVCDRAYNYASLLKRHMRIHTGENPYSCDDCGMMFHELVSLHYHRKKVHTGERPHSCSHCDRAFILSSDLKKHLKIHERDGYCMKPNTTKTYSRKSKPSSSTEANVPNTLGATPEFTTTDDGASCTKNENDVSSENVSVNKVNVKSQNHTEFSPTVVTVEKTVPSICDNGERTLIISIQEPNLLRENKVDPIVSEEFETNNQNQTIEDNVSAATDLTDGSASASLS